MQDYNVYRVNDENVDFWRQVSQCPTIEVGNVIALPADGSEPKVLESLEFPENAIFPLPAFRLLTYYRNVQMEITEE